jgi:flagellar basal-body rod modification protein FlgD
MQVGTDASRVFVEEADGATFATQQTRGGQNLGRDEFMRLLTAQLSHQDPLSPVTNEAFIAQLAQFSALEQMQGIRASLETSQLLDQSMNNFLASGLIGRQVRATGDTIDLAAGSPAEFYVALEKPASAVVSIVSESGDVVRRLEMGQLPGGQSRVVWDGKGDGGESLPAGRYRISIAATDGSGAPVAGATGTIGEVSALRFRAGVAYVVVGGREVPIDEVIEIRADS